MHLGPLTRTEAALLCRLAAARGGLTHITAARMAKRAEGHRSKASIVLAQAQLQQLEAQGYTEHHPGPRGGKGWRLTDLGRVAARDSK